MSLDGWVPLSQRGSDSSDAEVVLAEGVPPVLRPALRRWLDEYLTDGRHAPRVALRLGIEATMAREALLALEGEQLLGAVDAALHFHPDITPSAQPVDVLALVTSKNLGAGQLVPALLELLTDAGSAWTVSPSWAALERRVDPTVRRAPTTAAKAAKKAKRPEAARDLAEAWTKVYGRHPDPSGAYRLAIRAVEDVAVPVVLPTDKSATLGKVRTHLRDTSARWRTSMGPGAEPVVAMISSLWISQTDRHAGQAELARIDQGAAEQAVHLATTLVQWFAAGHVQRLP